MDLNLILLILYVVGVLFSLWFFLIREYGCVKVGFSVGLLYSVLWFIVIPVGLLWGYFYDKKQKTPNKKRRKTEDKKVYK